jgi:hypothetical protein
MGDKVLVDNRHKYPNGTVKTESRYIGPFMVAELTSGNTVRIVMRKKTMKKRGLNHVNLIRKWVEPHPVHIKIPTPEALNYN